MKKIGFMMALYLAVFAVYWPVKNHQFILIDDHIHITENPHFRQVSLQSLTHFWRKPYEGLYIPVTYSLWGGLTKLSHALYGSQNIKPILFHLTNLFFHAFNTCLVFFLLHLFVPSLWASFVGALFFGLHLAQVESVAWVSGFKDLSATFFGLLCLLNYFRGRFKTATLLFFISILSKPSMVALPLVAAILEFGFFSKNIQKTSKQMFFWLVVALPIIWITRDAQSDQTLKYITPLWQRPFVATDALAFYLGKTVAPLFSAADYSRTPQRVLGSAWGYVAWMVLVITFLILRQRHNKWRILLFAFCAALLPVLGMIPFSYQFFSTVADRYLYFPVAMAALAVAFLYSETTPRARILMGAIIVLSAILSVQQMHTWANDRTLFTHLIRINPRSLLGNNNLGTLFENDGDLDSAEKYYRRALQINPEAYPAMYNLGRTLGRKGLYAEALATFQKLLERTPQIAEAQFSVGLIYAHNDRHLLAIPYFERAALYDPKLVKAHYYLGVSLLETNQFLFARQAFDNTLKLSPVHLGAEWGLVKCDVQDRNFSSARKRLELIRSIEPKNAKVLSELAKMAQMR